MMPPPVSLSAIPFYSFEHAADLEGPFEDFSYGDAELTLVKVEKLCAELEGRADGHALLVELSKVPPGTLIAFHG